MSHMLKIEAPLYQRLKTMAETERRSVTAQLATLLDAALPSPVAPEIAQSPPTRESMLTKYKREHPEEFPAPAFGRK